jgi:hypothetical protein
LRELSVALALLALPAALWRCKRGDASGGAGGSGLSETERYRRRAIAVEASDNLNRIARAMVSYAVTERVGRGLTASVLAPQFPGSAPRTPADVPRGHRAVDPPGTWNHPTWQALQFALTDPHYYSYEVVSDGQSFTARALGDLDSDGVFSTFERTGTLGPGGEATLAPLHAVRETE